MMKLYALKSTKLDVEIRVILCSEHEIRPLIESFALETRDCIIAEEIAEVLNEAGQYSVQPTAGNQIASKDRRPEAENG